MNDTEPGTDASSRASRAAVVSGLVVVVAVIIQRAWVSDDCFITFRTIDNLVNGYGLRWNVGERVQSFTHPLWLMVQTPIYWLTRDVVVTTLSLSIFSAVGALMVASRPLFRCPGWLAVLAVLPLVFASSVMDYSTSGLENPLTFLLLALFFAEGAAPSRRHGFRLALLAALAALNRLDSLLFFLPALLAMLCVRPWRTRWLELALGFAPLAAWECFSLLYFGSLFPNTKYAKLPSNVEASWYLDNGWQYVLNFVRFDVVSATVLIGGIAFAVAGIVAWIGAGRPYGRPPFRALFGLGAVLYCVYVVGIGGDFMQGRFFSAPVFASILILWSHLSDRARLGRWTWLAVVGAVVIFLGVRAAVGDAAWFTRPSRIADERAYYQTELSEATLRALVSGRSIEEGTLAGDGLALAAEAEEHGRLDPGTHFVKVQLYVGTRGYFAGPKVVLIEPIGLTDPLLARLGIMHPTRWRIGHGVRRIPNGYLTARRTGAIDEMDPVLGEVYSALRLVAGGPLFARERLAAIVRLNLGHYDRMLRDYERANPWDFGLE